MSAPERGGIVTPEAHAEQGEIIHLLLRHGARPGDRDGRNRTARECTRKGELSDEAESSGLL